MSTSSSLPSPDTQRKNRLTTDAFLEIRACQRELGVFLTETFERLDQLMEEFLAEEIGFQKNLRKQEQEAVDQQVDRLASMIAKLARSVNEQKRLPARGRHP